MMVMMIAITPSLNASSRPLPTLPPVLYLDRLGRGDGLRLSDLLLHRPERRFIGPGWPLKVSLGVGLPVHHHHRAQAQHGPEHQLVRRQTKNDCEKETPPDADRVHQRSPL